jgi:hypothetical protein
MMETAFFRGVPPLSALLPPALRRVEAAEDLPGVRWALLALSAAGCRALERSDFFCGCGTLLAPGNWGSLAAKRVAAERVIGYGLASRDSLTFSSLGEEGAVLCVQRRLLRPDGGTVEPQELPLPPLTLAPEDALAVLGTWLLVC